MANAIIIQQVTALAQRAAGEINLVRTEVGEAIELVNGSIDTLSLATERKIGDLTTLAVSDPGNKASVVLAYNELRGIVDTVKATADTAVAIIDDAALVSVTNKTYSAKKITDNIKTSVDAAVTGLVNGSIAGLDTLKELAASINNDVSYAATVTNALEARLVKTNNLSDLSDVAIARTNIAVYSKTEVDAAIKVVADSIGELSNYNAVTVFEAALTAPTQQG